MLLPLVCAVLPPIAEPPLHQRINTAMARAIGAAPVSASADGAEFLRRAYLDLIGRIPTSTEARAFLDDSAQHKRTALLDRLLASPEHPKHLARRYHIMWMERLGNSPEWLSYLERSFAARKPYPQLVREILRADTTDAALRGADFFIAKRLENYGQNPVDYSALTRDLGRFFLGRDLRCAECHDHLTIDDYKQADFQGLFAFVKNTYLHAEKPARIAEKPTTMKLSFASVFTKKPMETGPRIPGRSEVAIPLLKPGAEYLVPPDRKTNSPGQVAFSTLAALADELPRLENEPFVRSAVNRIWFLLLGRGLIHPLDLDHTKNPPAYPEVLDLLCREFRRTGGDIRGLIREITLTHAYQRSSILPEGVAEIPPASFRTAIEKRLSAEQLLESILTAVGERERITATERSALEVRFRKAFANQAREPEDEVEPALRSALFLANDPLLLELLAPKQTNLVGRLRQLANDTAIAEELFLSVLSRKPTVTEMTLIATRLKTGDRTRTLGRLVWALTASMEFQVNH